MNKGNSAVFLTYKKLTDAVDPDSSDSNFRAAAEFLVQAITY